MTDKTNKNNTFRKDTELELEGSKVWLGDDGIVRIRIGEVINEGIVEATAKDFREIVKTPPIKARVLIDISAGPRVTSSIFRKNAVKLIKDTLKDPGFERIALWGGSVIQKVGTSFIITAAGFKNIKYFKTEKEALEWLKK